MKELVRDRAASGVRGSRFRLAIPLVYLCTCVSLSACRGDGPIPFEEPLEIIFGSSELNDGRIVADFDFGVPVPVVFNTEIGGFSIYSSTDPGFVPLGPRSVTEVPFGFPLGTPLGIRITEIDPEVRIVFSNGLLAKPGDEVEIGESPFDIHPIWQLSFPSGSVPEPRFVSFVLTTTAPEYQESEEYTVTIIVEEDDEVAESPVDALARDDGTTAETATL